MLTILPSLCLVASVITGSATASTPAAREAEASQTQGPVAIVLEDAVETWTAQGRLYLDRGHLLEARAAFAHAAKLDGNSLGSQTWLLRTQLAEGSINDALDSIDALARDHSGTPELDYLYGMAFALKAQNLIASGVADGAVAMNFGDAVAFLERAATAQPYRFRDASLELARSAWYSLENATARTAIDRFVGMSPERADGLVLQGRIAMSQFAAATNDPEQADEAASHWLAAEAAFLNALDALGTSSETGAWEALEAASGDAVQHASLVEAADQLARAYIWKEERKQEAARAWELALALQPSLDFNLMLGSLAPEVFEATMAGAVERFQARFGPEDIRDATLLWYLGKARYDLGQWESASNAFQASVTKWPAYANAWYYTARAQYELRDYRGSVDALKKHWAAAPDEVVATVIREGDLAIVDYLTGQASQWSSADAAMLSEICAEVAQNEPRFWNNMGLFLRDSGQYERAHAAYARALELAPENPNILNDTALMLHYHLERDLDSALDMYERAASIAHAALADPELDADTRDLYTVARRDARNNRRLLLRRLGRHKEADSVEQDPADSPPAESPSETPSPETVETEVEGTTEEPAPESDAEQLEDETEAPPIPPQPADAPPAEPR